MAKQLGFYDINSKCNIEVRSSVTTRSSGKKARLIAKIITSSVGKLTLLHTIKGFLGINAMMSYKLEEEETILPLVSKSVGYFHNKLSMSNISDLYSILNDPEDKSNFPYNSINDYHQAYLSLKLTPTDIINKINDMINSDTVQNINAILEMQKEEAFIAAEASNKRYANQSSLSVLDGVPFFICEDIPAKNFKLRMGTDLDEIEICIKNCSVVDKLLNAGAILLGTTKMTYLGLSTLGISCSRFHGIIRNPYEPDYYCGGCVPGAAAVVSSGLVPFTISIDNIGGVKVSSCFTGVVGMRCTYGRVSLEGYRSEKLPHTVFAPIASNVRDLSIVYGIISGPDEKYIEGTIQPPVIFPYLNNKFVMSNLKFGFDDSFCSTCHDSKTLIMVKKIIKDLKAEFDTKDINIPELQEIIGGCITDFLYSSARSHRINFGSKKLSNIPCCNGLVLLMIGEKTTKEEHSQSLKQRTRTIDIIKMIFKDIDILILPTIGEPISKIHSKDLKCGYLDDLKASGYTRFNCISTYTGIPSITIPIGCTKENFPLGIQLISPWWTEEVLLDVAYNLEKRYKFKRNPKLFLNPLN